MLQGHVATTKSCEVHLKGHGISAKFPMMIRQKLGKICFAKVRGRVAATCPRNIFHKRYDFLTKRLLYQQN